MKRNVLLALTFLLSSTLVYADKSLCPPDVVHCGYVTGLSDNISDGRYIKLANMVVCFNNYGLVLMDQEGAARRVGKNVDHYSICSDANGKHCEPIQDDTFIVSEKDNVYVANPKYFDINLAKVKNNYPACDAAYKPIIKMSER